MDSFEELNGQMQCFAARGLQDYFKIINLIHFMISRPGKSYLLIMNVLMFLCQSLKYFIR